jgi:predicted methyltransferase
MTPFMPFTRFAVATAVVSMVSTLFIMACANSSSQPDAADVIAESMTGAHRSESNQARDAYRHPAETLAFLGLEPDMTVIEVLPGGLWYTEILAPTLREKGQYVAAAYDISLPDQPEYRTRGYKAMVERFAKDVAVFGQPEVVKLSPPDSIALGKAGSVDMVVTFRSTHGWIRDGVAEDVYAAFFEVLKSGGVLGVVQHRAGPETDTQPGTFNGYVEEDRLIEIATAAGFALDARSEINANPKDKANYPDGVWTLPPSLTLKEQDREKYLAIGESDRMTLRFRKP